LYKEFTNLSSLIKGSIKLYGNKTVINIPQILINLQPTISGIKQKTTMLWELVDKDWSF